MRNGWVGAMLVLTVAVASCNRNCRPSPAAQEERAAEARGDAGAPPVVQQTINPQGPSYTGWDGGTVYADINDLRGTKDGGTVTINSGGIWYTFRIKEGQDPCIPSYPADGGSKIPLTLYTVTANHANVCDGVVYTTQRPGACENCESAQKRLTGAAVAIPGSWDPERGTFSSCDGGTSCFTVSCLTGAVGECAHWGYVPTYQGPDGRLDLGPYHRACVRAATADYGGNGEMFTCKGTYIDVYDELGIQRWDCNELSKGMVFESAWGEEGAVPFLEDLVDQQRPFCVLPRFASCDQDVGKVLHKPDGGQPFEVAGSCGLPAPNQPLKGRALLLTRSWRNQDGGQCVREGAGACQEQKWGGPSVDGGFLSCPGEGDCP